MIKGGDRHKKYALELLAFPILFALGLLIGEREREREARRRNLGRECSELGFRITW